MQKNWQELRLDGGRLCLDFTNTVQDRLKDPVMDYLHAFSDLEGWLLYVNALPTEVVIEVSQQTRAEDQQRFFERALDLREELYRLFLAIARQLPISGSDLNRLNMALADSLSHRRIAWTGGRYQWRWDWQAVNTPDRLLWPILLSAAEVLVGDDLTRIRECPSCGWLFYDQSKNASRTWCSMTTCGSNQKAKRYYQRKKSGD